MKRSWFFIVSLLAAILGFLGCEAKNNVTPRDGDLKGKVVNKGGVAIPSVLVSWSEDRDRKGLTDSTGNFFIEGITFGQQSFSAEKTGYRTVTFKAPVYANTVSTVENIVLATFSFDFKDIKIQNISANSAEITWTTTEYTNGYIEFGEAETLGQVARETAGQYSSLHKLTLTGLKAETRYFFRISANKENLPVELSSFADFTTISIRDDTIPPESPKDLLVSMTEKPNQVTLTWAKNFENDLKGYKIFRSELPISGFAEINNTIVARGNERYIDVAVVPGKKYYYRVTAVDQAGNEGNSTDIVSILVPGDITQRVQWTRIHNPYILSGDIDIKTSGVLEIESGVEVRISDYDALLRGNQKMVEIRVAGSIIASSGTEAAPITFASGKTDPHSGDWGGLTFNNAVFDQSTLSNVTVAHAVTGLSIFQTTATFTGITFSDCQTGLSASKTSGLTLSKLIVKNCDSGMLVNTNNRLTISECTTYKCKKGIFSFDNDTVDFKDNNLFDYEDYGLYTDELGGLVTISGNLFVSAIGLGLHLVEQPSEVTYNTFDSACGIRIDRGSQIIQKNIVVGGKSLIGNNSKGIEFLATETVPIYGPNDVAGFPSGNDYIGCASTANSLAVTPNFVKDRNPTPYDYRLIEAIPDSTDPWGITRTSAPPTF